ncbi:unnamed protein product [Ectocarpus fasciculatus]
MPLFPAIVDRFKIATKQTSVAQEVLAGVLGWQTVVQSLAFYASLLVGDDESVDQNPAFEAFLVVAGASTMAFGAIFNVPFIVAPSVLYSAREASNSIGGHLAAQALANFGSAMFFALALKLSFVSLIPTALRLGAGCGISVLVSVLGMRNVGVLVSNSFTLQAITWQIIVGLGIVTAACGKVAREKQVRKWMYVLGVPMAITFVAYGAFDRSKFRGYSEADHPPLSHWGTGTFGMIDFSELREEPRRYSFYVIRTFLSVIINISSILLILIDAVCLEDVHTKVKSSREVDFSNAIGGTKKFRSMACAIPCLSLAGNFMGVTTQAAFVQSMILVFAGGKTGLSAVVTGALLLMTTVMWPLLSVLAPGHVSGALTMVISLRFFTVIRMIDVNEPRNLLMFGMSILLIPFSFDFVDAVCIATVLGFLCEGGDNAVARFGGGTRAGGGGGNKVAVLAAADEEGSKPGTDCEVGETTGKTVPYGLDASRKNSVSATTTAPPLPARRYSTGNFCSAPTSPSRERGRHASNATGGSSLPRSVPLPSNNFLRRVSLLYSNNSLRRLERITTSDGAVLHPRRGELLEGAMTPSVDNDDAGSVHWGLALVALAQLLMSAIDDHIPDE